MRQEKLFRMIIDWTITGIELLGKAIGHLERAAGIEAHGGVIDQTRVPLPQRPKRKWYPGARDLENITAICLHITAVRGGFGARRRDVAKHLERGVSAERARVLAQADRFLATPYHAVSAAALIRNLPEHVTSWHGHGANRYSLGYAVDMGRGDHVDIQREQDRFESILVRWSLICPNLRYVEAHRQHHAMRGRDPGPDVFAPLHEVAAGYGVRARPRHVTGTGRPLPADWLDTCRV